MDGQAACMTTYDLWKVGKNILSLLSLAVQFTAQVCHHHAYHPLSRIQGDNHNARETRSSHPQGPKRLRAFQELVLVCMEPIACPASKSVESGETEVRLSRRERHSQKGNFSDANLASQRFDYAIR